MLNNRVLRCIDLENKLLNRAAPFLPPAKLGWVSVLLSFAVPQGHNRNYADPSVELGFFWLRYFIFFLNRFGPTVI